MHLRTGLILHTAVAEQHQHDVTLAREHLNDLPQGTVLLADLGYQGLVLTGARVLIPFKTPRQGNWWTMRLQSSLGASACDFSSSPL